MQPPCGILLSHEKEGILTLAMVWAELGDVHLGKLSQVWGVETAEFCHKHALEGQEVGGRTGPGTMWGWQLWQRRMVPVCPTVHLWGTVTLLQDAGCLSTHSLVELRSGGQGCRVGARVTPSWVRSVGGMARLVDLAWSPGLAPSPPSWPLLWSWGDDGPSWLSGWGEPRG